MTHTFSSAFVTLVSQLTADSSTIVADLATYCDVSDIDSGFDSAEGQSFLAGFNAYMAAVNAGSILPDCIKAANGAYYQKWYSIYPSGTPGEALSPKAEYLMVACIYLDQSRSAPH